MSDDMAYHSDRTWGVMDRRFGIPRNQCRRVFPEEVAEWQKGWDEENRRLVEQEKQMSQPAM